MDIKWQKDGLCPVVVQDKDTGELLMLAYADREALRLTIGTKTAWFFSRSRQKLWNKGETSGNFIRVSEIRTDCDGDALLYMGKPMGPVCHTGHATCFFETLWQDGGKTAPAPCGCGAGENAGGNRDGEAGESAFGKLYRTVLARKTEPVEGSYTRYLFEKGLDKILKKVGEESAEVIIAAKGEGKERLKEELCDLFYHLIVLMANEKIALSEIEEILSARSMKTGNLKPGRDAGRAT